MDRVALRRQCIPSVAQIQNDGLDRGPEHYHFHPYHLGQKEQVGAGDVDTGLAPALIFTWLLQQMRT